MAKGSANELEYVNNNNKLIDEINKSVKHKQEKE